MAKQTIATAWIACDAAKVTPRVRRLRRCHRVHGFGHSRASAAAPKARQKNNSEVRAVKRITMRAPSTSNCRMPAIQIDSTISTSVSTANSRQPSNQFFRCDGMTAPPASDVIINYIAPDVIVNRVCSAYIHVSLMLERRMSLSARPKRRPAHRPSPPPKPYHHGDLRRVLIDAALSGRDRGGAVRGSGRRPAGAVSGPWDGLFALGDA